MSRGYGVPIKTWKIKDTCYMRVRGKGVKAKCLRIMTQGYGHLNLFTSQCSSVRAVRSESDTNLKLLDSYDGLGVSVYIVVIYFMCTYFKDFVCDE